MSFDIGYRSFKLLTVNKGLKILQGIHTYNKPEANIVYLSYFLAIQFSYYSESVAHGNYRHLNAGSIHNHIIKL